MTYTCPCCGRIFLTELGKDNCTCRPIIGTCPRCHGSGIIAEFLGPNQKCPSCGGTGKIRKGG